MAKSVIIMEEQNCRKRVVMKLSRNGKGMMVAGVFAALNAVMAFVKIYMGATASSVAIMSDGVNNGIDALGCGLAIAGFALASKPSDDKMPNGYGKIEEICSLIVSCLIVCTGVVFAAKAIDKFAIRDRMAYHTAFCWIMAGSVVLKLFMAYFAAKTNKGVKSPILKTEALDSILDACVTAVTLVVYVTTAGKGFGIDAIAGFCISVAVIVYGVRLTKESFMVLAGRRNDEAYDKAQAALSEAGLEVQNLRLHGYGYGQIVVTATVFADSDVPEKILNAKNKLSEEGFDSCLEERR